MSVRLLRHVALANAVKFVPTFPQPLCRIFSAAKYQAVITTIKGRHQSISTRPIFVECESNVDHPRGGRSVSSGHATGQASAVRYVEQIAPLGYGIDINIDIAILYLVTY